MEARSYSRYGMIVSDAVAWDVCWQGEMQTAALGARDLAVRAECGEDGLPLELTLHGVTDLLCHDRAETDLPDGRLLVLVRSAADASAMQIERDLVLGHSLERMHAELEEICAGS